MALYPAGTARSADLIETVERFTDRVVKEDLQVEVFDDTALLNRLWEKRTPWTGSHVEAPVAQGETGTTIAFTPYGTNDAGTSARFTEPDLTANIVVPITFHADFVRLSLLYMAMNRGSEQRINYVKTQLFYPSESIKQQIAAQILTGTGTLPQLTGLDAQVALDGNHFLLNRSLYPSLLGNVYDATDSGTTTSAADGTASATVDSTTVTITDTSNLVVGGRITFTADAAPNTYRVAKIVNATDFELDVPYRGATAAGKAWTYAGVFSDTTTYGASGVFDLAKMDLAYYEASDGNRHPDLVSTNFRGFARFSNELQQFQRWIGDESQLSHKGYTNFRWNGAAVVIDNHEADGVFRMCNTDYLKLYTLRGFESFTLNKGSLTRVTDGSNVASVVGEIVVGCQLVHTAPKRDSRVHTVTV